MVILFSVPPIKEQEEFAQGLDFTWLQKAFEFANFIRLNADILRDEIGLMIRFLGNHTFSGSRWRGLQK
jgi:hypothetical protein